ncbi:gamma carbonic anhydrase family protein [Paracoccus sp. JM45]|uniref:gamma carbonic anhydrase family protein n=1 Tax=Paracoccus sp. JM45 TaxID=2283626 RepID=UPI000E6CC626|nr:gamma carbonic anhydrase family protein [Paracoccus sp. JM45]RJE78624.1 gamma carbonic anhydrase family protein [Paracoccus sp. JM45]
MAIYRLGEFEPVLPKAGSYWIAPQAVLAGRIRVGQNVGIWFGAVLRAEAEWITIGDGTNIQDGCVLHVDPGYPLDIGRNCTIGHRAIVHGCTIGDNTLIGMGTTILNGARIGRNCLIGANCLITENKVIPDNSLIMGSPGKVIRELDNTAIRNLTLSAEGYQQRWRQYADDLEGIE